MLNPRAVFTQATSSHAEARSPRFVRVLAAGFAALRAFPPIRFAHLRRIFDPRLWTEDWLSDGQSVERGDKCVATASSVYLPNILPKCDRFDLSPRTNGKSKCSETRPMGAGRRQIESVALCVWQCHLRNVSTLSNRTQPRLFCELSQRARSSRALLLAGAEFWWRLRDSNPRPAACKAAALTN